MGHFQSLDDLFGVARLIILEQSALKCLALGGLLDEHRLEGVGIETGVEHAGADRAGRRVEILHLLRAHVVFIKVLGQINGVFQGAARVAGHQIRHKILFLASLLAQLIELVLELIERLNGRLAHVGQRVGCAVFGRDLELTGDVVLHQLFKEGIVRVGHQIVEPDAAADKDLLDAGQFPDAAEDLQVIAVVDDDMRAGGRRKAVLAAVAHAAQHLLPAGRKAEVCGRAADIVDIALEIRLVGHALGLGHDAVRTAAGDAPPLMELDGAEVTAAETAAVLDDGELHLPDGRNAAHRLINRMIPPGVGQSVDFVQLPAHKGLCRDILDEVFFTLLLDNDLAADDVLIVHLDTAGLCVGHLIGSDLLVTGALDIPLGQVVEVGQVAGAVHISDGLHRFACGKTPGDFHGLMLAHAEADDIRA